jgi:hypothetical protein
MTLFEKAARVFDGRPDPVTGLRVLRLVTCSAPPDGFTSDCVWRTMYHQHNPFMAGGRKLLLQGRTAPKASRSMVLDLESGLFEEVAPGLTGYVGEVSTDGLAAVIRGNRTGSFDVALVEAGSGRVLNRFELPGWIHPQIKFLEPRLLCVGVSQGQFYDEPVHSRFYLIDAAGSPPRLILDEQGYFCNHMMPRPGRPDEFSYDRWPTPKRPITVITRLRTLDGSRDHDVPLAPDAQPIGPIWGGQRDHYLWTPDGSRLVSYFSTGPEGLENHFDFSWWISCWDPDTGREDAVAYPPERWGCNFAVTPDSRFVVSAGGRGFQHLYRVELAGLAKGWNEQLLCAYPKSDEEGGNHGPFHMPHVLPDGSGAVFCAGWPGPEDGVYLVELPPS